MQIRKDLYGNLQLIADEIDKEYLKDLLEDKEDFTEENEYDFWHGGINSYGNNCEYRLMNADDLGHLSEAPCMVILGEEKENFEEELLNPSEVYYYEPYMLKSFLKDLLEKGETTFKKLF